MMALILSLTLKSVLIAGAGLVCASGLARRPSDRADILRATVCLLLALPVVTLALPAWELALLPAPAVTAPEIPAGPLWQGEIGPVAGVAVSAAMPWPSPMGLVVALWLAGGALIVGRLVLGVLTLDRWTSEGQVVTCPAWRAALDRLSPGRRPRLVTSARLTGPLSWGVPPGTILLDPASLSDPGAADAILAHELAHLRRGDWVFLVLSRLTLALFWFNPWSGCCTPRLSPAQKKPPMPPLSRASTARPMSMPSCDWPTSPPPTPLSRGARPPWRAMPAPSRKGSTV